MKRFARWAFVLALGLACLAGADARAAGVTRKPAPPRARYEADYRRLEGEPSWRNGFPKLGNNFEVLAPSTDPSKKTGYNCIAHTLRIYYRWVWEGDTVSVFDRLYGQQGYRRLKKMDFRFNPKLDKVVLYAKRGKNGQLECTHGARQLADGTWTSKLGAGPLIRHDTPYSVSGPSYGRPIAVYVRPRA
jgi:type VI secretion system secreted protein VgrG